MPIVVGDIVTPHIDSTGLARTALGPVVQPQPPLIGIVNAFADPATTVLWASAGTGNLVATINDSGLDVLDDGDSGEVTRLKNRFVRIIPSSNTASPEFQGVVVSLYVRDLSGDDSPTPTLALVRTTSGLWYEIQSNQLEPVDGR